MNATKEEKRKIVDAHGKKNNKAAAVVASSSAARSRMPIVVSSLTQKVLGKMMTSEPISSAELGNNFSLAQVVFIILTYFSTSDIIRSQCHPGLHCGCCAVYIRCSCNTGGHSFLKTTCSRSFGASDYCLYLSRFYEITRGFRCRGFWKNNWSKRKKHTGDKEANGRTTGIENMNKNINNLLLLRLFMIRNYHQGLCRSRNEVWLWGTSLKIRWRWTLNWTMIHCTKSSSIWLDIPGRSGTSAIAAVPRAPYSRMPDLRMYLQVYIYESVYVNFIVLAEEMKAWFFLLILRPAFAATLLPRL